MSSMLPPMEQNEDATTNGVVGLPGNGDLVEFVPASSNGLSEDDLATQRQIREIERQLQMEQQERMHRHCRHGNDSSADNGGKALGPLNRVHSSRKRLLESERIEIIKILEQPDHASKRSLGRRFGVTEAAIRHIWVNRDKIRRRSAYFSKDVMENSFRVMSPMFPELEDKLYEWVCSMKDKEEKLIPSDLRNKACEIARQLNVVDFKASWKWLSTFRRRRNLQDLARPIPNPPNELHTSLPTLPPDPKDLAKKTSPPPVVEYDLDDEEELTEDTDSVWSATACSFAGYEKLYAMSSRMDVQLWSYDAQLRAPSTHLELKSAHEHFQRVLKKAILEERELQQQQSSNHFNNNVNHQQQ